MTVMILETHSVSSGLFSDVIGHLFKSRSEDNPGQNSRDKYVNTHLSLSEWPSSPRFNVVLELNVCAVAGLTIVVKMSMTYTLKRSQWASGARPHSPICICLLGLWVS